MILIHKNENKLNNKCIINKKEDKKMKILKKLQDRVIEKTYKNKETGIKFNVRYDTSFIMTTKKVIESDLFDDFDREIMINRSLSRLCLEEDKLELFDIYIEFPVGFYRKFSDRGDYVKVLIDHNKRKIIEKELKFLTEVKKELDKLLYQSKDYEKNKRLIKELVSIYLEY